MRMAAFTIQVQFDAATMAALNSIAASLKTTPYTSSLQAIATSLTAEEGAVVAIGTALASIAKSIETPLPPVPISIRLALPSIIKNGRPMANFELANDEVATIPILVDDAAGTAVPAPSGDTFTAVSSSPSLGVSIVASPAAVVLTPLVQASPGITVTVSDSAGLTSATLVVDIVPDTTPKAITLNVAAVTETPQPVPTAPGP